MPAADSARPDDCGRAANQLETRSGTGDIVQARDVHGGVHFHQQVTPFTVVPRQLPGPGRGFVNRDTELAYLAKVAIDGPDAPRVVIITGTAGVGKTSVALRCAHSVQDRFPDGQLYTNLRGYDPGTPAAADYVLGGFLRDLGVPTRAIPPTCDERAALYRSLLADRRMLVVLDNAATVGQVRPLLPGAPETLAIVTSRSHLSGLVVREGARRLQLDLLSDVEAVELLRSVTSGYRSDDAEELAELATLCARLPLALRIAAERAASRPRMPLVELIADLRDESGLWDALSVDDDEGADAVRTVFAWSYRSLPESGARLFRLLGLHPGNEFSVPAAAAVAGITATQARHDLDTLVGAHLVELTGPGRYQFHDLLRAFAVDQVGQLEPVETRVEARRRALAWYLYTADAAQSLISPYDRYPLDAPIPVGVTPLHLDGYELALRWYRTEAANLAAAVELAAVTGEHATAWRLAAVLRGIYMHQNAFDEWIATARTGVESAARVGEPGGEADSLVSLGMALFQSGALADAEACHRRALSIRRGLGDRFGEALSVNALGLLAVRHRRLNQAHIHFREAASIFAALDERRWVALLHGNLAEASVEQGDFETAATLAREALSVFRDLEDRFGAGDALLRLAWAHRGAGRLDGALAAIMEALEIAERDDNDVWRAHWLAELARIQLALGQPEETLVTSHQSAVIQRRLGDRSREAVAIGITGQAYHLLGRHDDAVRFCRRAADVHRDLGDSWQRACALAQLAAALDANGEQIEARLRRQEAVALLANFDDRPAIAMRERLAHQDG